jgi:hypothetical protein
MAEFKTSGQLSHKALSDQTTYDALEVAHASTDDVLAQLYEAAHNYQDKIDEREYCIVMVIAKDPLLVNLKRRKFYCWPWLPSPRPNQAVFLYNKMLDRITNRLWVLPCEISMAILGDPSLTVGKEYASMKRWSISFYRGSFWRDIRDEHKIKMLSQEEYFELHREELLKSGIDVSNPGVSEPFDFSKISAGQLEHSGNIGLTQDSEDGGGQT